MSEELHVWLDIGTNNEVVDGKRVPRGQSRITVEGCSLHIVFFDKTTVIDVPYEELCKGGSDELTVDLR